MLYCWLVYPSTNHSPTSSRDSPIGRYANLLTSCIQGCLEIISGLTKCVICPVATGGIGSRPMSLTRIVAMNSPLIYRKSLPFFHLLLPVPQWLTLSSTVWWWRPFMSFQLKICCIIHSEGGGGWHHPLWWWCRKHGGCRNMSGHSRWAVQPLDWRRWYLKINSYVVVL